MDGWKALTAAGSHKVLSLIERCRTADFGYHAYRCGDSDCGAMQYVYHSCRNRHCPQCGNSKKEEWIEARMKELLPVKYYHAVFTIPHQLNSLVMGNRKAMFTLLFDAASYTLLKFAKDPQYLDAQPGIITILHTWGQQLSFHPHVHCIVSGGGIDKNKQWKEALKAKHLFLFPVKAVRQVYRAYFLKQLQQGIDNGTVTMTKEQHAAWPALCGSLYSMEWIAYFKEPMGGPAQVLEYLGRYTHKVAISNHRIKRIDMDNNVTFEYKDYADGGKKKKLTLSGEEFLRRYEQHLLPPRFCRIRHYGYLGNYKRKERVNELLQQMALPPHAQQAHISASIRTIEKYGTDVLLCSSCKKAKLELLYIIDINKHGMEVQRE
ncbi:MAG: IS91 family transposase [Gammaproteobacteria bacterium]|nr:IS91 family transposase [Gammaproteobacteria bacterium]